MKFQILSVCKGGGYRYCRTKPKHPRRNSKGLYPLHRVLMENKLDRLLRHSEIVHHRNGDRTNDRISNLEVLSNAEHSRLHARRAMPVRVKCDHCKKEILRLPMALRRAKRGRQRGMFCSVRCAGYRPITHGGATGYRRGCRCAICTRAWALAQRIYRAGRWPSGHPSLISSARPVRSRLPQPY